jgi:hypothetical protein
MEVFIVACVVGGLIFGGLGCWVATQKNRDDFEGLLLAAISHPYNSE